MNYWVHRISHQAEVSYPLLNKGYLTIGFSALTDKMFIDKVLEDNWNYINSQFQEKYGRVPRNRYNLYRFLRFNKGDIVIIPGRRTFRKNCHFCFRRQKERVKPRHI